MTDEGRCLQLKEYLPGSKGSIFLAICTIWTCSILSVSRCTFFLQQNLADGQNLEMGLFGRSVYDKDGDSLGCVAYTDHSADFIDSMFKLGRAFGIINALCTSIVLVFVSISILLAPKGCEILWSTSRFYAAAGTIGQMFSFFVLNSSQCTTEGFSCRLASVGKLAVFNIIFLGAFTVKMFIEAHPTRPWIRWYQVSIEDSTLASSSKVQQKKETLSVVDPFTAEFVPSGEDEGDTERDMTDNDEPMLEMEGEDGKVQQSHNSIRGSCAVSVGSHGSRVSLQSVQESLASTLGIQSLKSFRLVFTGLVAVAWIISILGVQHCTFLMVGPSEGERTDYSGLGLFSRAAYYKGEQIGCLAYPDETIDRFDQAFQSSRIFGTIAAFLMTGIFVISCILLFVQIAKDELWLVMRVLLPCATISQVLVFFGYKTETCTMTDLIDCRPGGAGIMVIINIFLLVSLSIILILIPPPPSPVFRIVVRPEKDDEATSSYTRTAAPPTEGDTILPPSLPPTTNRFRMSPIPEGVADLSGGSSREMSSSSSTDGSATVMAGTRKTVRIEEEPETIHVEVEFVNSTKRTIKTITHKDGSQTITTTVEEIEDEFEHFEEYADGGMEEVVPTSHDEPHRPPTATRPPEVMSSSANFASLRQMFGG